MNLTDNKNQMLDLAEKLGIPKNEFRGILDLLRLNEIHIVDMLPEMLLMIRSVIAEETLTYRRKPIEVVKRGLLFSFQIFSAILWTTIRIMKNHYKPDLTSGLRLFILKVKFYFPKVLRSHRSQY